MKRAWRSRASVPACDQRERADNGAIATPYIARATNGSVGGSERTSVANSRASVPACDKGSVRIWSEVTPYNKYLSIKTCIKIS